MNDVPFTGVIIGAKQYTHVAIAHTVWASFLALSLDSVGCTLNNSQQWQRFKFKESVFCR